MNPAPVSRTAGPTGGRTADRIAGLDAARAIAVVAMVFGHIMDATLSEGARQVPWVVSYWNVRAFTAPLFLFLSGWVLHLVLSKDPERRASRFLPRAIWLFVLGLFARLPIWDLGGLVRGDAELWRYFLTFDALHAISVSMAVLLALTAAVASTPLRSALLGVLAGAVILVAAPVWTQLQTTPSIKAQLFGGGTSIFPLLPWTAYFFAGAVVGPLVFGVRGRWTRIGALVALSGACLVAAVHRSPWPALPPTDAWRFLGGIGVVTMVIAVALALPERIARMLAPAGRASLWAYVFHLPIAYGWGYWPGLAGRVGHALTPWQSASLAVGVVAVSVVFAVVGQRYLGGGKWKRLAVAGWQGVVARLPLPDRAEAEGPEAG